VPLSLVLDQRVCTCETLEVEEVALGVDQVAQLLRQGQKIALSVGGHLLGVTDV